MCVKKNTKHDVINFGFVGFCKICIFSKAKSNYLNIISIEMNVLFVYFCYFFTLHVYLLTDKNTVI